MKLLKYIIPVLLLAQMSCKKDPFLYQKGSDTMYITSDNILSFKLLADTATRGVVNMYATVVGNSVPYDRTFTVEIDSSLTNVSLSDYTIGTCVIPANSYHATIPITVKRTLSSGLNIKTVNTIAKLALRFVPNENFGQAVANNSDNDYPTEVSIQWCDYLTKPSSWNGSITYYIGPFKQSRYKFIRDYTGITDFDAAGITVPNSNYVQDMQKLFWLQAVLMNYLSVYNATHTTPYMNDDGVTPLKFGTGLSV